MNGLPLLAREVEASLILSTYMSTASNHWSAGPISFFPPCYRLKMPHRSKTVTTQPMFQHARCCILRNKSQRETIINQRRLFMFMCPQEVSSIMFFFPSSSFCKHNFLNGNNGNKRYEYDKMCCISYENLIRIVDVKEIVE